MKTEFSFNGLMVPVFTPFMDDKKMTVNCEMIDKYAHYLMSKGMHGVMVNGFTGEGMVLTVEERKRVAEEWYKVTRKYEMKMLLNIGGMALPEIYELAQHAEKLQVDAVMVLPDNYYKPYVVDDLVKYIKDIHAYMPSRPLLYYHIPFLTNVYVDLYKFVDVMSKEVPTFCGIYYADGNIDKIVYLKEKKPDYLYIIGMYTSMAGYMMEGFNAFSMVGMNLYPEMLKEMYDYLKEYKMHEAYALKEKYTKKFYDHFHGNMPMDYIYMMKQEMDKMYTTMKMGMVRKPNMSMYMYGYPYAYHY